MHRLLNGEVWLANLNPGRGSEPSKVRPVLIVQGQALLDAKHPSTLIVPLTTQLTEDAEPLRIRVVAQGRLAADSDLLIDQLRAIDNRRLIDGPLLRCDSELMVRVYAAIRDVMET
jgi:mRNA interferase MazF